MWESKCVKGTDHVTYPSQETSPMINAKEMMQILNMQTFWVDSF